MNHQRETKFSGFISKDDFIKRYGSQYADAYNFWVQEDPDMSKYLTTDEIDFLRHIHKQRPIKSDEPFDYSTAKQNYQGAIPKRYEDITDWDRMLARTNQIRLSRFPDKVYQHEDGEHEIAFMDLAALLAKTKDRGEARRILKEFQVPKIHALYFLETFSDPEYSHTDLAKDLVTGKLMDPTSRKFYGDALRIAGDTVKGLPQLPGFAAGILKERLKPGDIFEEFDQLRSLADYDAFAKKYPLHTSFFEDFYKLYSPEEIKETFENNQWEIPSMVMELATAGVGVTKAPKVARLARYLDIANPAELPFELGITGLEQGGKALKRLKLKKAQRAADPTMDIDMGKTPAGDTITHQKSVGELQAELGLEASDVPPSVRLDSKPIKTEEAYRRKTMDPESEIVQRLDEQHIATKEAIEAGQTKLVTDLQVENPFDENAVGQQFNKQFDEHRNTIDKEISDEYNEATDNVLHKYLDEQGDLTDENITGSGKEDQADVEGDIPGDKAGLGVTPTKNPDGSTFYPQITEAQLKAWDEDPDIYFRIDEKGRREEQGWMGEQSFVDEVYTSLVEDISVESFQRHMIDDLFEAFAEEEILTPEGWNDKELFDDIQISLYEFGNEYLDSVDSERWQDDPDYYPDIQELINEINEEDMIPDFIDYLDTTDALSDVYTEWIDTKTGQRITREDLKSYMEDTYEISWNEEAQRWESSGIYVMPTFQDLVEYIQPTEWPMIGFWGNNPETGKNWANIIEATQKGDMVIQVVRGDYAKTPEQFYWDPDRPELVLDGPEWIAEFPADTYLNTKKLSDTGEDATWGDEFGEHEGAGDFPNWTQFAEETPTPETNIVDAPEFNPDTDLIPNTLAFFESKRGEVYDTDLEQIATIVTDLLEKSDIRTVQGIKDFRTQIRRKIKTAYRNNEISEMGSGAVDDGVYQALTKDLHAHIERLGGTDALEQVKAIDKKYADIIDRQRETEAGKLLFDKQYVRNPERRIRALANGKLGEGDLDIFYDHIGEEATHTIRAGIVAHILNRSNKDGWSAKGLANELKRVAGSGRGKHYLKKLLGDDQVAEDIAIKLYELAEYSKRLDRVPKTEGGSQTAFLLQQAATIGGLVSLGDFFYMGSSVMESGVKGGMAFGAYMIGSRAIEKGLNFARRTYGDKKFLELINDERGITEFLSSLSGDASVKAAELIRKYRITTRIAIQTAQQQQRAKKKQKALGGYEPLMVE